jgi:succinate dehydrogenase hydrophobic membrane anchor protein
MISYLWQRISGLFLLILLSIHLFLARFSPLTYENFKNQIISPKWIILNIFLVILATSHALNGLWQIGNDYLKQPKTKKFFGYVLWLLGIGLSLLGVAIFI